MSTWEEMIEQWPILRGEDEKKYMQHRNGGWIRKTADVTGSKICDYSLVLGYARVKESTLNEHCLVMDNASILQCDLTGKITIKNNVTLIKTIIAGDVIIGDDAKIYRSKILQNSTITGSTKLDMCKVIDATVNINGLVERAMLHSRVYTDTVWELNSDIFNLPIQIFKDTVKIGCQEMPIEEWIKKKDKLIEEHCIKVKHNYDKLIKAVKLLQELKQ